MSGDGLIAPQQQAAMRFALPGPRKRPPPTIERLMRRAPRLRLRFSCRLTSLRFIDGTGKPPSHLKSDEHCRPANRCAAVWQLRTVNCDFRLERAAPTYM